MTKKLVVRQKWPLRIQPYIWWEEGNDATKEKVVAKEVKSGPQKKSNQKPLTHKQANKEFSKQHRSNTVAYTPTTS